jgi:hypothetical protein
VIRCSLKVAQHTALPKKIIVGTIINEAINRRIEFQPAICQRTVPDAIHLCTAGP